MMHGQPSIKITEEDSSLLKPYAHRTGIQLQTTTEKLRATKLQQSSAS